MSSVTLRDATPEDGPAIAHVRTRTWQIAYAQVFTAEQLGSISEEGSAEWWSETIARRFPRAHTLVAEKEQRVVGFASLGQAREDASRELGELYAIYVLPEASGRGIGQALMAEVLSRLRKEGFAEAILWVLEDNPRTRRFYELAAWRIDGGAKEEEWLGTLVREIRYRIALDPSL